MEDCIFCKIATGAVPSEKVHHEEGSIVSFPDKHPQAPGHTLIIPSEHYRWFYEVPEEISDKLYRVARQVATQLKKEYDTDYVKLLIDGKDVPHVHLHLVPQNLK